jgi:hypothetical protein
MVALLFVSTGVWSAQNNNFGGGPSSFMSCDTDNNSCICATTKECFEMEKHCDDPSTITCKEGTSNCTCKWKAKSITGFGKTGSKTNNNFLLKK